MNPSGCDGDFWLTLGGKSPNGIQDEVCRGLLADMFESLYDARWAIVESQSNVAFPLLRRAFESISLLAAGAVGAGLAATWAPGKEVPYFSEGAHSNRDLVPIRFLAKGSQFVLSAIGRPDLLVFCDHLRHHLSLWFWSYAAVTFHYRELTDLGYGQKYLKAASDAKEVRKALLNDIRRLRSNPSARWRAVPPRGAVAAGASGRTVGGGGAKAGAFRAHRLMARRRDRETLRHKGLVGLALKLRTCSAPRSRHCKK